MSDKNIPDTSLIYDVYYQAGLDEPCVFTGNHRRRVSIHWLTWYIRKNPTVNLLKAQEAGEALIKRLEEELPRKVDPNAEPVKFIEVKADNDLVTVARLEWIIWYAHVNKVGYGSAWHAGNGYWPAKRESLKILGCEVIDD